MCPIVNKKNSIRDARTPQTGEMVFNTMRYRSSKTVQRSGYFQSSVSYIKLQIISYLKSGIITHLTGVTRTFAGITFQICLVASLISWNSFLKNVISKVFVCLVGTDSV